jgi:O-glycosyl hydrolase
MHSCSLMLSPDLTSQLEHFDSEVLHDTHQIIPFILAAMKKAKKPIELLASPWSPPAWMKVPVIEVSLLLPSPSSR